jgi:hypothetical protein
MNTHEIPRPEWSRFFKDFSKEHAGRPCTIEILSDAMGAQYPAMDVPLASIDEQAEQIVVALGENQHVIEAPEHVWLLEDGEGDVLEIESSQTRTLLRFDAGNGQPRVIA